MLRDKKAYKVIPAAARHILHLGKLSPLDQIVLVVVAKVDSSTSAHFVSARVYRCQYVYICTYTRSISEGMEPSIIFKYYDVLWPHVVARWSCC